MRYFLHLAYDGSKYRGWQRQLEVISVQSTLEHFLSEVFKVEIKLIGCGRTDAGVHASQYYAHFDIDQGWDFDFLFRINKRLPKDIVILDFFPVKQNNHTRFDVASRSYSYFVHRYKTPALALYSGLYEKEIIQHDRIVAALNMLTKYSEYRAFCRRPDKMNTTLCHFTEAKLFTHNEYGRLRFDFTANRFLTGMIRLLVGELLAIGEGLTSLDSFKHHLSTGELMDKHRAVDPQGLHLTRVIYPYLRTEPKFTPFDINLEGYAWAEAKQIHP